MHHQQLVYVYGTTFNHPVQQYNDINTNNIMLVSFPCIDRYIYNIYCTCTVNIFVEIDLKVMLC